jgi:hypothetical protein
MSHEMMKQQHKIELHKYYNWPPYWAGGCGAVVAPVTPPAKTDKQKAEDIEWQGDQHLRSMKEVIGYHIQATDDEIGHVEDFIVPLRVDSSSPKCLSCRVHATLLSWTIPAGMAVSILVVSGRYSIVGSRNTR